MQYIVIFKFKVFDESIKQKAMNVLWAFSGFTSVKVEEEGRLKVTGEFNKFEMTKELKKIDESVDILEDGVAAEAEVNKPSNDVGSSNWTTMQPYELWEQAKVIGASAAEKAKFIGAGAVVIGAGAAEKAKVIGAGAAGIISEGRGILAGVAGYFEKRKKIEELRRRFKLMNKKVVQKKGTTQNSGTCIIL